jgi:hypothetical protein
MASNAGTHLYNRSLPHEIRRKITALLPYLADFRKVGAWQDRAGRLFRGCLTARVTRPPGASHKNRSFFATPPSMYAAS